MLWLSDTSYFNRLLLTQKQDEEEEEEEKKNLMWISITGITWHVYIFVPFKS